MNKFEKLLGGEDLRSLAKSKGLEKLIKTQTEFDELFASLLSEDRLIVMRAADVIEKVSKSHAEFLQAHTDELIEIFKKAGNKELKWHLAQLIPRLELNSVNSKTLLDLLYQWVLDKQNSRIVRVNALQSVFELSCESKLKLGKLKQLLAQLKEESIPSINARIRKIEKMIANG